MTFEDLKFEKHFTGDGIIALAYFDNGYGASVINTSFSYGGRDGGSLYEVAVLKDGSVDSTTDITDDVLGWQDEKDVTRLLNAISKLDSDGNLPKGVLL